MTLGSPKATQEELDRILTRLNHDFGLNLARPDPTVSPSKRRASKRTEEQRLNETIYTRIHMLHFKKDHRLDRSIRLFGKNANQLLAQYEAQTQARDEDGRASLSVSIALHQTLLECLPSKDEILVPRRTKRHSKELLAVVPKRSRGEESNGHMQQCHAVDAIPVRSKNKPLQASACASGFNTSKTTNSSRQSFVSDVFSAVTSGNNGFPDSQTTVENSFWETETQDSFAMSTQEEEIFNESFSALEASPAVSPVDDFGYQHPDHRHEQMAGDDTEAGTVYPCITEFESAEEPAEACSSDVDDKRQTLDEKLKGIWRRCYNAHFGIELTVRNSKFPPSWLERGSSSHPLGSH